MKIKLATLGNIVFFLNSFNYFLLESLLKYIILENLRWWAACEYKLS